MTEPAQITPATLNFIRAKSVSMTDGQIASELGWSVGRLRSVATSRRLGVTFSERIELSDVIPSTTRRTADPSTAQAHHADGIIWHRWDGQVIRHGAEILLTPDQAKLFHSVFTSRRADPKRYEPCVTIAETLGIKPKLVNSRVDRLNKRLAHLQLEIVSRRYFGGYRLVDLGAKEQEPVE